MRSRRSTGVWPGLGAQVRATGGAVAAAQGRGRRVVADESLATPSGYVQLVEIGGRVRQTLQRWNEAFNEAAREKARPVVYPARQPCKPVCKTWRMPPLPRGNPPQQAAAKTMTTAKPDDTSNDFRRPRSLRVLDSASDAPGARARCSCGGGRRRRPQNPPRHRPDPVVERLKADLAKHCTGERSASNRISSRDRENAALQARVRELEQEVQQLHSRAQAPAPSAADDAEDDVLSTAEDLRKGC